jgi:hypothetical protein
MKIAALLIVFLAGCGCFLSGITAPQPSPKVLLLFRKEDHKDFLGCLNCVDTSEVSVCNEFGKYGSEFNSKSIWDSFGDYGSSCWTGQK